MADTYIQSEIEKLANKLYKQKLEELKLEKKKYTSDYNQANKAKEHDYHRQWIQKNNEKYLAKRRENYKDRLVKCKACNIEVPKYYYKQHTTTKKHIKNLSA